MNIAFKMALEKEQTLPPEKSCKLSILMSVPEEYFKVHSTYVMQNQGYHVKNNF